MTLARVDENRKPIPGTEETIPCDTLLLSVGLIPENELTGRLGAAMAPVTNGPAVNESLETSIPGVFACGNVLHVHDLVDYVSQEAEQAGRHAAQYIAGQSTDCPSITLVPAGGVRYMVPQQIRPALMDETLVVRFRVGSVFRDCQLNVYYDGRLISSQSRKKMAPGEMEQIVLKKKDLCENPQLKQITIEVKGD